MRTSRTETRTASPFGEWELSILANAQIGFSDMAFRPSTESELRLPPADLQALTHLYIKMPVEDAIAEAARTGADLGQIDVALIARDKLLKLFLPLMSIPLQGCPGIFQIDSEDLQRFTQSPQVEIALQILERSNTRLEAPVVLDSRVFKLLTEKEGAEFPHTLRDDRWFVEHNLPATTSWFVEVNEFDLDSAVSDVVHVNLRASTWRKLLADPYQRLAEVLTGQIACETLSQLVLQAGDLNGIPEAPASGSVGAVIKNTLTKLDVPACIAANDPSELMARLQSIVGLTPAVERAADVLAIYGRDE